jgi:DNA polymerase-3 subunit beta
MNIGTNDLRLALSNVEGVLLSKPSIAIIAGLLFEVDKDEMTITATDLENTLRAKCTVLGDDDKKRFVVPGKQFINLVKGLTVEIFEVKIEESRLLIHAGKSVYKFPLMQAEEFPKLPEIKKDNPITFKALELANCLQSVAFCVDKDEPRPHFRGVLVDVLPNKVVFVGTDTRTLALKSAEMKNEVKIKALLPVKTVAILNKILTGGDVSICISQNSLYLERGDFEMVSQLLAGSEDFPDYTKIIPSNDLTLAEVPIGELRNIIDRLSVFFSDRYRKLMFSFSKGKLELSVVNPERGEAKEEIDITYEGNDITIAFNPAISDFIDRAKGEALTMALKNGNSPILFTGEDKNWKYIAMPLKVE